MKKVYKILAVLSVGIAFVFTVKAQSGICNGSEICLVINARGNIQWQSSTDSMMTWVDESGAVNDTFCVTPTQNTWYHAYVVEGTCDTIWSDPEYVVVNDNPVADAGGNQIICTGQNVCLGGAPTATGGTAPYTYTWSNGNTTANPCDSVSVDSVFILTITDANGCVATDTANVTVDTNLVVTGIDTFVYSGAIQYFVVPNCVNVVTLKCWGAQGGTATSNSSSCGQIGGLGGYATGDLAVNPGDTLWVYVGGKGEPGDVGGWNGGGSACTFTTTCSRGGGASDIRVGGQTLNDRVIVAGGGGGAEYSGCVGNGGYGGGLTGGTGTATSSGGGYNGTGGTQSAGGISLGGASGYAGTPGVFGIGGTSGFHPNGHAGGGGGGWYGGGGGGADGHGGGGSSYTGTLSNSTTTSNQNAGDGRIIISW